MTDRYRIRSALPAWLALLAAAGVRAQTPPVPRPAAPGEDVVVRHRGDASIARTVRDLTSNAGHDQLARWHAPVCLAVRGLDAAHAAYVVARLREIAAAVAGPRIEDARCSPSVVVIVAGDAPALARRMARENGLFANRSTGLARGEREAAFSDQAPVRWIGFSRTNGADGLDTGLGYGGGSRIARATREDSTASLALVDAGRLAGISWAQLADYLAMIVLARPDIDADWAGQDTILSIFADRARPGEHAPPRITDGDLAFLKGLYASNPSLDTQGQRSQIEDRVRKGR